tara:strand:- start:1556 stop:2722 length:1167 start_codon:yes stop_codon:yes gene_type:complete
MRFIDFYEENKIIPVVDNDDIKKKTYLNQRENFYYSIKINISNLKNKNILELCPGTGTNAQFLVNKGVKKITLVDYNSESIKVCKKKFSNNKKKVKIIYENIYKFSIKEKFDYIIIENALSNLSNPFVILEKASKMLKKDGHLVFSFCDQYSLFSEKIRGYIAKIILLLEEKKNNNLISFDDKTKLLSRIFDSHLKKLNTDTRSSEKWVQDNLLLNEWWSKEKYLPLYKVIDFFNKKRIKLNYWSSSPIFFKDFTWYKKLNLNTVNSDISKHYRLEQVNFIDIRKKYNKEFNFEKIKLFIKSINNELNKSANEKYLNLGRIKKIIKINYKFILFLKKIDKKNPTAISLESFNNFLENILKNNKADVKYLRNYSDFWGKGTMQVSFIKY